jgi:hypothetical protein
MHLDLDFLYAHIKFRGKLIIFVSCKNRKTMSRANSFLVLKFIFFTHDAKNIIFCETTLWKK